MRAVELRLCLTLLTLASLLMAAGYTMAVTTAGGTVLPTSRVVIIAVGMAISVLLAVASVKQEMRRFRTAVVRQFVSLAKATSTVDVPTIGDKVIDAAIAEVRTQVSDLRQQIQQMVVQRKSLEIQLRLADAERRQTLTMIHGISDAVVVTNEFDELIMANPPAESLFHFATQDKLRTPIDAVLGHARLAADIKDMRQQKIRSNRRGIEHVLDVDGQPRTFMLTQTCVTDGGDEFRGVVTVLHDTTREKEVSKMKSEFVSHVSHELRTPLSSIKAYAEMLVDGEAADDQTRTEFYHVIQSEAERLSRLIDNILNISRIESGMTKINKKPNSISGILKQVLEVAMPSAREKSITLVDQVEPSFFQVEVDRDMIYQAALNLVSNAIKYTPSGGTVRLVTSVDAGQSEVAVKVIDNGVGIPEESMKHLFAKFYRVEAHKGMAKGSGLGLNLTRQLIETVHKGRMIVESQPGKGSTFGFVLPIMK